MVDVIIGSEVINFELVRPLFTDINITGIDFNYTNEGDHVGNYFVGNYQRRQAGVRFGRESKYYMHEAEGLARLSHDCIPRCYTTGELKLTSPRWGYPLTFGYMVLQHFPGKPLRQVLDFSTKEGKRKAVRHLLDIVDIIDYMHSKNVVHNDIRPEHILIYDGRPRLIDFHLWEDAHTPTTDFCGCRYYPMVVLRELNEKVPQIDDIPEWEPPLSFGKLLVDIVPSISSDSFLSEIKVLGEKLTGKSDRYVYHPLSRDYTSRKLRETLERLEKSLDE